MNPTSTTTMCTRSIQHIQRIYNKRADRCIFGSAKNASAIGGGSGGGGGGGGGGAYYDSQSARWITPHDPHFFRLTVDPNESANENENDKKTGFQKQDHLISLSNKYSHFNIPLAMMMMKTNLEEDEEEDRNDSGIGSTTSSSMHEVIKEYAKAINDESILVIPSSSSGIENEESSLLLSSFKFPKNILFDVVVDASIMVGNTGEKKRNECIQHVLAHFQRGNRVRSTIINFLGVSSPWEVGSLAGELCDAGSEEIFLNSDDGKSSVSGSEDMHVDDLVQVMEEICYIDAPGGPMLGRLGLNYLPGDNEAFFEEALCDMGVSKLTVKERHLDQCLVDLERLIPDMSAHDIRIKK